MKMTTKKAKRVKAVKEKTSPPPVDLSAAPQEPAPDRDLEPEASLPIDPVTVLNLPRGVACPVCHEPHMALRTCLAHHASRPYHSAAWRAFFESHCAAAGVPMPAFEVIDVHAQPGYLQRGALCPVCNATHLSIPSYLRKHAETPYQAPSILEFLKTHCEALGLEFEPR